ncbi:MULTISPECIES: hypothetical protein [unclassified Nocardiopsis]|uniref:hypothetical protein n=1 Tax=unclassified Nocardiopsis TaxID=2649073 RepID=UPI00066AFF67|nr:MULTISPECIES: hypothetical protein [unclassified Nocardiopsis]MBQ1083377.1 hypothetical protein [Nocardiopsis sp. B62]
MTYLPRWLTSPGASMVLLVAVAVTIGVLIGWMFAPPPWVVGTIVGLVCGIGAPLVVKRAIAPEARETDER